MAIKKSPILWHSRIFSIVHQLVSSSQLHFGNPLAVADTHNRSRKIKNPDDVDIYIDPIGSVIVKTISNSVRSKS